MQGAFMTAGFGLDETLLHVRRAFDQAFAVAPITTRETFEDLLAIRVAGDPYALRVREMTGLVASRKIVPLPSRRPELLGLAGIRGGLVAVYSLGALLGYGADSKPTSWLALARAGQPIAFAFDEFEGFVRARSGDVHAAPSAEGPKPHTREVVLVETKWCRIVDIPSTIRALEVHPGVAGPPKES